jgi:hypothetical protein
MPAGFDSFGKTLMIFGAVLFIVGLVLYFGAKVPWLGRLPGDIHVEKENFSFYFPVVTCILLSVILTVIFNLFGRR